jgi:sorting nexin-29
LPQKRVKLCRILNNAIHGKVKIGRHLSSKFKVNIGLGQEDSIASLLFNVVLETAIRRSKIETQRTIFQECS